MASDLGAVKLNRFIAKAEVDIGTDKVGELIVNLLTNPIHLERFSPLTRDENYDR
jgi:hypothetical protein